MYVVSLQALRDLKNKLAQSPVSGKSLELHVLISLNRAEQGLNRET